MWHTLDAHGRLMVSRSLLPHTDAEGGMEIFRIDADGRKQSTNSRGSINVPVSMRLCGRRIENGSPIFWLKGPEPFKRVLIEEIFANAVISIVDTAEGGQGKSFEVTKRIDAQFFY